MAKAKKRRIRSPHPGVVLIAPKGAYTSWRARCDDADTEGTEWVRLDPTELPTLETRRDWAIKKSKAIAKRKMEIELGGARSHRAPLQDAIDDYYEAAENRLRESTTDLYKMATTRFVEWAKKDGITSTEQLTAAKLPGFRDWLLKQRKHGYAKSKKKGSKRPKGEDKLSPQTVNWQIRAVKSVLNDLRLRNIVPLTRDAISDNLKPVTVPKELPEFYQTPELIRLLDAALKHDNSTFVETRNEHAGVGTLGTTERYEPIAPFLMFTLLTGCRVGEVLSLKWSSVDLTTVDADGKPKGQIHIYSGDTKTKHARLVTLEVCPSVRELLSLLPKRGGGVFGHSRVTIEAARRRLTGSAKAERKGKVKPRKRELPTYDAPRDFSWQILRSTCATYQTNAPGLFGAASAWVSAKRLGHSVQVSEKHYAGLVDVPRDARTLEAAMGIEKAVAAIIKKMQ